MIRSSHQKPIYREVLLHAMRTAWSDRSYWILALFAGVLATAGSYDVLWKAVTSLTAQGQTLLGSAGDVVVAHVSAIRAPSADYWLIAATSVEILLGLALILLAVAVISCASQGALVYAIGVRRRGEKPTLREAWKIGARAVWPIIALNVLTFTVLWILRFLAALPLYIALANTTATTYLVYIVSFIVFVPLVLFAAVIHVFALNALILQGAPLLAAVRRGIEMIRTHWVVVIETVVLQVAISIGVFMVFLIAILCATIPLFAMIVLAGAIGSIALFTLSMFVAALAFVLGLIFVGAFTIHLQYATWTYLYRRLGEGGVMPKVHRIFRNATGFFGIKG